MFPFRSVTCLVFHLFIWWGLIAFSFLTGDGVNSVLELLVVLFIGLCSGVCGALNVQEGSS